MYILAAAFFYLIKIKKKNLKMQLICNSMWMQIEKM